MLRSFKLFNTFPTLAKKYLGFAYKSNSSKLNSILLKMPKEREHIVEAQKQRHRIKEKGAKYIPGTVNLQVLGNGSASAPATVYLFTDQNRYLFNCGEGTQRLAHEHKTKLSRLEHIFITRTSWDRLGGLPGLSLTVQDAGVPNITLHGPPGLGDIFSGMRRFVVLKDLKVQAVNCENGEEFEDQVMNVKCIPLKFKEENTYLKSFSEDDSKFKTDGDIDYFESASQTSLKNTKLNEAWRNKDETMTCAYICKLKPRPGSLNLEKCVEKGVPPGPLLGQLKNGFDVTLPNGTTVRADEVRAPTDPGPVFIFLDIPTEECLPALEQEAKTFEKYQNVSPDNENTAVLVVHFSQHHVMEHNIYKKFMQKFPKMTKHLILNSNNLFSGYIAAHRIQYQLNQINNDIFPLLKENIYVSKLEKPEHKVLVSDNIIQKQNEENIISDVMSLTSFNLRPRKTIDRSFEPIYYPTQYLEETRNINGFAEVLSNFKSKYNQMRPVDNLDSVQIQQFPKVLFLGTGSCIPNKTRNVSSILLHTAHDSCMLLDCGEGTWGQILRFYGEIGAVDVLKNLKSIYISHLHADHHIGLIGLLRTRKILGIFDPLILFAPIQIQSWLNFYDNKIENLGSYILVSNADMAYESLEMRQMGIKQISTCFVKHCPNAFAISVELLEEYHSKPIKITYSGDSMPCEDLIKLGKSSTLLIHEATMEDELQDEAIFKMHSTVSQAILQGQKMSAEFIILTHFSQRYAKLPRLEKDLGSNVGLAFDNMQVCLDDLKFLPMMYPTLKLMFSEHCEELEQKALKRSLRSERKRQFSIGNKESVDFVSR